MGDIERLTLAIDGGPDTDDAELNQLTRQLRRRLLELDIESVETVRSTEVPPGAKPGEVIALGMLAVHLAPHVLPSVVSFLTGWSKNRPGRQVELTIGGDTLKLTGATHQDQERALELFLLKHATG
jgi:hypothetical protein